MISTEAPSPSQKLFNRATAAGSVPAGGVRMHQRLSNRLAKPDSGPEYSVPARGWAGTNATPGGTDGAISRIAAFFTEPTPDRMAPAARCGATSAATDL